MARYDSYGTDYRGRSAREYGARGSNRTRNRYDAGMGRYGADLGRYGTPFPGAAGYPSARWGWGPIGWAGWGMGMEAWPYAAHSGMMAYGFDGSAPTRRRPPQESDTYGSGGDRALRRWARRYGYDMGYEIRPRRGR
jgi:hypothetical protein